MGIDLLKQVENLSKEDREFLNDYCLEDIIKPLHDLGFRMEDYHAHHSEKTGAGHHMLFFEEFGDEIDLDDETPDSNYSKLKKICTQDDDSQPHATYRLYLGNLWLFIPFTS